MSQLEAINSPKSTELLQKDESAVETFLRSAVYTGVQVPISGVSQLLDRATGANTLPNLQFIDAPQKDSLAANLGSLTATAGHCALMLAAAHKTIGPVSDLKAFSERALVAGGLGGLYGGVFTPVGNEGSFMQNRLNNFLSGSTALAGMSGFTSLYRDVIGKGVTFADSPFYHGMLVPGSLAGLATMSDTYFNSNSNNSVFLPGAKSRSFEHFMKAPQK